MFKNEKGSMGSMTHLTLTSFIFNATWNVLVLVREMVKMISCSTTVSRILVQNEQDQFPHQELTNIHCHSPYDDHSSKNSSIHIPEPKWEKRNIESWRSKKTSQ